MHSLDVGVTSYRSHQCEGCGSHQVFSTEVTEEFPYGDGADAVLLKALVPVWSCGECGLQYTDETAERLRHEAVCGHLGRLSPRELVLLRKASGMNQESFAALTSIGVASIKRWEAGNQIQNASMDKYLRLLASGANIRALQQGARGFHPQFRTEITESKKREALEFRLRVEPGQGQLCL